MNYGNTVGSRQKKVVTWSRAIRDLQHRLSLNSVQRNVLIGTILGDGCLAVNAYKKNYRLKIEHSDKQKKYVEWKYRVFKDWCLRKPVFQKRTNSWVMRTISHPIFTEFRELFYRGRKKILPRNIKEMLINPLILAVWFMDDGALGPHRRGFTFNTQNFTREESEHLMDCLRENFQLSVSLHKDKKSWRIYVLPSSTIEFKKTISRLVLPELQYKLSSV